MIFIKHLLLTLNYEDISILNKIKNSLEFEEIEDYLLEVLKKQIFKYEANEIMKRIYFVINGFPVGTEFNLNDLLSILSIEYLNPEITFELNLLIEDYLEGLENFNLHGYCSISNQLEFIRID